MRVYEEVHRVLAARSFAVKDGNVAAAVEDFRNDCDKLGLKHPADVSHFVRYWGTFWKKHRHVRGKASSCGRKRKLSQEDAELLVADLMSWAKFGLKGPFQSLEQLKQVSPRAKAILEAANAATSTVISTLKEIEPKLAYKKLTVKQKLSKKQMQQRLLVAQKHVNVPRTMLHRVVWVDAKTMYMTIKTRCGWVRLDDEIPFETTRPASKKKPITLRYYIGVCARAGAVFLAFYTGTTGMPANRDPQHIYLVSSPHVQLRLLLGCCCCDGPLDCFPPACCTASPPPRQQPHHLKMLPPGCCC
jgi:hypothetical protein